MKNRFILTYFKPLDSEKIQVPVIAEYKLNYNFETAIEFELFGRTCIMFKKDFENMIGQVLTPKELRLIPTKER